jgi:S1-C subfamily serine protease
MEFMKMRYQLAAVFMAIHFLSATPGYCGANDSAASGSLSRVFQKVNSSVVLIVAMQRPQSLNEAKPPATVSSGVIVSKEGEVMTAAHSVYVSDTIAVQFHDGKSVKAKVVSSSAEADVALLKLESIPENMAVARFGDSDKAQVGDQVLVIGAPYGIGHTLTVGHISGRRGSRTVCQQLKPFEFLQTDAAINQGNSGGPMFDVDGKVIGIVSRILSSSGGSMGLGFAVSINTAKELLLEQKNFWIRGGSIPAQIGNDKILVGGDIILAIQGFPVTQSVDDACAIQDVIGGFTSETEIELKVLRAGEIISLTSQPKAQ